MNVVQQQVRRAQLRLWLNRWLSNLGWCLVVAGAAFVVVTLVRRLMGVPIGATDAWVAAGLLAGACVTAGVWMAMRREQALVAATVLDEASGLKERISSGLYCAGNADPFAQAVHQEAERVCRSLSVRRHIRLRYPKSITFAGGSLLAAVLVFWLVGPVETQGARRREQGQQNVERIESTKAVVKRSMEDLKRQLAQTNPAVKDMEEFAALGEVPSADVTLPSDLIRDQMKKLDNLAEAVQQKRSETAGEGLESLQKMLRQIQSQEPSDKAVRDLARSLAEGDFKGAQEAIKQMQEQLAKAGDQQNKEQTEAMKKQLGALADKLAQMGDGRKLEEEMKKAGLDEQQAKRMLENLNKKDLEQIKKELSESGLKKEQVEKLLKKMKEQQSACKMASRLGSAMKQASQGMGDMQTGQSAEGLDAAMQQLSEMEMLQEEMKQLDSTLAQLSEMKDGMGQQCGKCNGTGMVGDKPCSACQGMGCDGDRMGQGGGMGKMATGQGGIAPERETKVGFKQEREKVKTDRGRIVGQFLVDGQQVAGESKAAYQEALTAAEREATDAVNEDRIPRKYQKAVKSYHSLLNADVGEGEPAKP